VKNGPVGKFSLTVIDTFSESLTSASRKEIKSFENICLKFIHITYKFILARKIIFFLTPYVSYDTLRLNDTYGGEHMATINLRDFSNELHRRGKIQAAKEGITLKELIKKALLEYLEKKGG